MKCILYVSLSLIVFHAYGQADKAQLQALLKKYYPDHLPGASVLIQKDHKLVFQENYGLANITTGQKLGGNTNFNIGSLTKQFTAFCIVQLAAQKKLSLQDKLLTYFPGFNTRIGSLVTLQQLLTHSSGIVDHYAFTDTARVKHAVDKDVLDAVKNIDSTYFTPGTQYRYSNTAYCLLALIIEKISGLSYRDYLKKNIFVPLQMTNTVVLQTGKPIAEQALGYDYDSSKNHFNKLDADEAIFFSTEGDGGIYTSANDYLKWWRFLQAPTEADKNIVRQIRSAHFPVDTAGRLSYGYGWFVSKKDKTKAVYHTGSNGGFRAIVFSLPEKDYMVAIFSNRTGIDLEKLVEQINEILGVTNNSFTKIEALVSFINSSPIFAPCKEML